MALHLFSQSRRARSLMAIALLLVVVLVVFLALSLVWLSQSDRLSRFADEFIALKVQRIRSQQGVFDIERVANDLHFPWGMAFIPHSPYVLITEKISAQIVAVYLHTGEKRPVFRVPDVVPVKAGEHCGLLDISLHPQFARNRLVYVAYIATDSDSITARPTVARARFQRHESNETLFTFSGFEIIAEAGTSTVHKGGCGMRMAWLPDTTLLVGIGYEGTSDSPTNQLVDSLHGKIIRINDDGSIPADNPFVDDPRVRDEIYSLGHRDAQGIAVTTESPAKVWASEHGPYGGDELNLITPGSNYGWPVVSYGYDYVDRSPLRVSLEYIGLIQRLPRSQLQSSHLGQEHQPYGFVEPVKVWGRNGGRSIAPSGLLWYSGTLFPEWTGDIFIATLYKRHLLRLELDDNKVTGEEKLLNNKIGRVRHVAQGPRGALYVITDADRGGLYRLTPAQ